MVIMEKSMDEQERDIVILESTSSALAAFTLSQFLLYHLLQSGSLSHAEAIRMLKQGVEANARGGPVNQMAGKKLQLVLNSVEQAQKSAAH
jgi:hypothetical protein